MSAVTAQYTVDDYEKLLVTLQSTFGIVVPEEQRGMMVQRLLPLMDSLGLESLNDLAVRLGVGGEPSVQEQVLSELSHFTTVWHLSSELRGLLHDYVFDQLKDGALMWVVGCGRGELAWSVAMELDDFEHQTGESTDIDIVASDSLPEDMDKAVSAAYFERELAGLGDGFRKLYFATSDDGNSLVVKERIRRRVEFKQCDLIEGCQSLGQFDVIICPEVLAYFSNGVRAQVIEQFSSMLKPGGILLVGSQQTVQAGSGLERVDHPSGVFYRRR